MKYIITRASSLYGKPTEDSKLEIVKYYKDIRWFSTIEEWKDKLPKDWASEVIIESGYTESNHPYRIVERNREIYTIEISDLLKFMDKYGAIIILPKIDENVGYEDLYHLEIYDYYRE